ncbi:MAG: hypothetical protein J1G02_00115 [Clostridiales bacterium]|nr:hypothetical protein [Clostridiales bacterium]
MSFIRSFSDSKIERLESAHNAHTFALLKADVLKGEVFPAVRNERIDFYYLGGCLYSYAGTFFRDPEWEKFSDNTDGLSPYDKAKKQVENKYAEVNGGSAERKKLNALYRQSFASDRSSQVVVLDIEIGLGKVKKKNQKCDLLLLNNQTSEIIFVEGKVYKDPRVRSAVGQKIEVIDQVNDYTEAIVTQSDTILQQYCEYVNIVNKLFGTSYAPPQKLITPAKLLVYDTGVGREVNIRYTVETTNNALGANSVMWVAHGEEPSLEQIWKALI